MSLPAPGSDEGRLAEFIRVESEPLSLHLSATQLGELARYALHLQRWNATYNLTAARSAGDIVSRHIVDCLAAVPPLRRWLGEAQGVQLLDVGSGAGLPGLVFAVSEARLRVTCLDTVGKKIAFIRSAVAELRLSNVEAVQARVEGLPAHHRYDIIVSRAFASIPAFAAATARLLNPSGVWLALKGKVPTAEIDAVQGKVDVFHVERIAPPGLNEDRCLVWMRPLASP